MTDKTPDTSTADPKAAAENPAADAAAAGSPDAALEDAASSDAPGAADAAKAAAAPGGLMDAAAADDASGDGDGDGGGDAEVIKVYRPKDLPDHLAGENDATTIDKLLKAYKGARSGDGKAPKSPDDYDLALTEDHASVIDIEGNEADANLIGEVRALAHKHGLTNEQFAGFIPDVLTAMGSITGELENVDLAKEFAALGGEDAATPKIQGLMAWGQGMLDQEMITADEFEEFKIMGGTALGIKVLEKLRGMTGEKPLPTRLVVNDGSVSDAELDVMLNSEKYSTDPAYQKKVDDLFAARNPD